MIEVAGRVDGPEVQVRVGVPLDLSVVAKKSARAWPVLR